MSFYAFHRQYYVQRGRLHRRQKERFLTVTGLGYPAQAARDHAEHEFHAKRTLYAYMPCAGLRGVDFIDEVVTRFFEGSYASLLRAFVENSENIWCPTWVRQNYMVRNPVQQPEKTMIFETPAQPEPQPTDDTKPTPKKRKKTDEDGEPPDDTMDDDQAASSDPWAKTQREKWQQHNELGPNLMPQGTNLAPKPWMPNINPVDFDWCARWPDINVEELRAMLNEWKPNEIDYDRPDLTKETLDDDYQRLFVELLLEHSAKVLANLDTPGAVPPLRLLLLGTAGTGKTTATQTALQELRRLLIRAGYPLDFYRAGAYTGCAAFNVRFGASTLHRLFQMLNPFKWSSLEERSAQLDAFQKKNSSIPSY